MPHSPATSHCPSGDTAANELFVASQDSSAWVYSAHEPSGASTRNSFAPRSSRW